MDAFGSPIGAQAIEPPLITRSGFTPKNAGDQSTRSASLPCFDRADLARHPLRDRGVDGVFRDVALHPRIVVALGIAEQRTTLRLHLVRSLPGANDHLADAAHRLTVRRHHRQRAEIVQYVLGRDRLSADAAFGECHVLRDRRIEVMAHHQHIEMLIERVRRVGTRRIGRTWQHVGERGDLDDVGRVAATGAFGVERMDGAAFERRDGVLNET